MKLREFIEKELMNDIDQISDEELIREIQTELDRIGYNLTVDGVNGPLTEKAWARFKKDNYLSDVEKVGAASLRILLKEPTPKKGFFLPTNGEGWVSSPFGPRGRGYHKGIDIAANEGTPVYAIANGILSACYAACSVGNYRCGGGYGNYIYIQHGGQPFTETRYAHLSRLAEGVKVNIAVQAGDVIGYVGNTGHSFGNHLHFETRVNNTAKNPLSFINPIV